MKARAIIVLGFALLLSAACGQNGAVHVNQFSGGDVGTKVTNAMATCSVNPSAPCILVIDPSLASYPMGTMPTLCAQCYLFDYRAGQSTNKITAQFVNGVPQADQFPGADFCAQLRAANVWALANNYHIVDATHFPKTVSCGSDPWNGLKTNPSSGSATPVNLTDLLPAADIQATVPVVINNSGVHLVGMGNAATWWDYIGSSTAAIVSVSAQASGTTGMDQFQMREMSVIGGSSNATDAIYTYNSAHMVFEHVSAWGVTGCGIHFDMLTVTTRLTDFRTSINDANTFGWASRSTPAHSECLNSSTSSSQPVQDYVAINSAAEGTTGHGWALYNAAVVKYISGTSEQSTGGDGIYIDSGSSYVSIDSVDIEHNHLWGVEDHSTTGVQMINPLWNSNGSGNVSSGILYTYVGYNNILGPYLNAAYQLTVAGGSGMTANHGNGASIQHSDGTGTNQPAYFDGSGNLTASTSAVGYATLSSGTVTVSTSKACTASATCSYTLNRCVVSGTAMGSLSVGTVAAGTSFVINSLSATNTVVSGDNSAVCWRVN